MKDLLTNEKLQALKDMKNDLKEKEVEEKQAELERKRKEREDKEKNKSFEELFEESSLDWKNYK
ncbi:YqkE family protein [Bacillus carboniphilus]|uniref:YqkE family protein n=1 Tax=Bacillus carboniphilus TaxID=86663 RepID=A0ABY9JZ30_9BACI|nr:YqkE family protein [Bacillus carboniphilus]WLR43817.1 YqkE family protein [Bacillus carboniphilus]